MLAVIGAYLIEKASVVADHVMGGTAHKHFDKLCDNLRNIGENGQLPPNHDLLKAVRIAMLNATLYMAKALNDEMWLEAVEDEKIWAAKIFNNRLVTWINKEITNAGETVSMGHFNPRAYQRVELLIATALNNDADKQARLDLERLTTDEWITEIKNGLTLDELPEMAISYLEKGWKETDNRKITRERNWFGISCFWFGQLLKKEEYKDANTAFQNRLLSEIAAAIGIVLDKLEDIISEVNTLTENISGLLQKWEELQEWLKIEFHIVIEQLDDIKDDVKRIKHLLENNNSDLIALRERKKEIQDAFTEIDAKLKKLIERIQAHPDNEDVLELKIVKEEEWRKKYNELQIIEKQEKEIIEVLRRQIDVVFNIDETTASERLLLVKSLFERGKATEAMALLNTPNRGNEIQQFLKNKEITERIGKNFAEEEVIIALNILQNIENPNRIQETVLHFEQSLKCNINSNNLFEFAKFYYAIRLIDKALDYLEKALDYYSNEMKTDDILHANIMNNLGIICLDKGNLDSAIEYLDKATSIYINVQSPESRNVAKNYINFGIIYKEKGNLDKAIDYLDKALEINLKLSGENGEDTAINYINLGYVWQAKGDLKNALFYYELSLSIFIRTIGEDSANTAVNYTNIGTVLEIYGDHNRAIKNHERALKIYLKLFGEKNYFVINSYINFGFALLSIPDIEESLVYFEKATLIALELFDEDNLIVAQCFLGLASALYSSGRFDETIKNSEKGIKIARKLFGEENEYVGRFYDILGRTWSNMGNWDKSFVYLQKALEINLKLFWEKNLNVSTNYDNIARLCKDIGNLGRATEYLEKSLNIHLSLLGENNPFTAASYNNLSEIFQTKGDIENAIKHAKIAHGIYLSLYGEDNQYTKSVKEKLIKYIDN